MPEDAPRIVGKCLPADVAKILNIDKNRYKKDSSGIAETTCKTKLAHTIYYLTPQ
jgi:hypothetical protein